MRQENFIGYISSHLRETFVSIFIETNNRRFVKTYFGVDEGVEVDIASQTALALGLVEKQVWNNLSNCSSLSLAISFLSWASWRDISLKTTSLLRLTSPTVLLVKRKSTVKKMSKVITSNTYE
jgi:hypothetical protein